MKAKDIALPEFLNGPKQFLVPIFQRDYSWGLKHCEQLWNDVERIGNDPKALGHFLGSVVYIAAEDTMAGMPRWLIIDGQQRLTTVTLLLIALREILLEQTDNDSLPSHEQLDDNFLRNRYAKGDRRHRLVLRNADQNTLAAMLDQTPIPDAVSARLCENLDFFREKLSGSKLPSIYEGISKLQIVDVALTLKQDDPQLIFESLNSTGMDLTEADLIRNFVLMRQDEATQTKLYQEQWQPMEDLFGARYRGEFDKFMRDYLSLELKPSKQFRSDQIYARFRDYFYASQKTGQSVDSVLGRVRRFGGYYARFILGKEPDLKLKGAMQRVRTLIEVASPLVMRLYACYDDAKTLSKEQFIEAIELIESYVFRRAACDMQSRSLWQAFASLSYKISDDTPLISMKIALARQGKSRRFPTDAEFRTSLESRDVYDMRQCNYLLDRLENDSREKIDTSSFTIEHVMPQNEDLKKEWREMLGPDWKNVWSKWLHRLGNVTLTGYNPNYSDRPFKDKKTMEKGFNESPLRLNKPMRDTDVWTEKEMDARGKSLAKQALKIWPPLVVDVALVRLSELEDMKARASKYSLDTLTMEPEVREVFESLVPAIKAIHSDVVELFGERTVVYRAPEFFVEIIPRKKYLTLLLNLEFDECPEPSDNLWDANENSFITHATEDGGVGYGLGNIADIPDAMKYVRLAYEKANS